ncbi:MAG: hypothetical protein H8E41_02815 [Desulfobulbaceae bacterium]|uniref:PilZ domain-containing protein n=1 Tax=Candidatus Desulfobia pelagia TaxID=2841692 RepID=A0A8J6TE02_9BACT|nr:hypothetical protein [Candidatus Desulfobia pelagia]
MRSSTVFVNEANMALIHCPHCDSIKQVPVSKFKGSKHTLKVKCACGDVFQVDLNFRKNIRKQTALAGLCYKVSEGKSAARECLIKNLSFRGIGLKLQKENGAAKGDEFIVSFTLDDAKMTKIKRKMIVHHIEGTYVGGAFVEFEGDTLDKAIGFYLMH